MATQEIGIEYEGHQVIVPYDVVVLIVHAKETAGFPFQPYTTLVDKYIADIIKSYAADRNSEDVCYDYRALMNGFEVLKIWARVLEKGGIRNCYHDQTLKPAAAIFKELNGTIQKMAPVRGYDAVDHLLFRKLRSQWKKAWDDEEDFRMELDEETEWEDDNPSNPARKFTPGAMLPTPRGESAKIRSVRQFQHHPTMFHH